MRFYYSSHRAGPFVILALLLAVIVLLPVLSGFFLIATAAGIVGWVAVNLRRSLGFGRPGPRNPAEAKVVVMDRDDRVISIQD